MIVGMKWNQFTLRRLSISILLFGLSFALLVQLDGVTALVFFAGLISAGTLFGAAVGVLFNRTQAVAALGAVSGLAFFIYAVMC